MNSSIIGKFAEDAVNFLFQHFRGGFDQFFGPEQIVEVDLPGLTSPMLNRFTWTRLPRPVIPLDEGVDWHPPRGDTANE